MEEVNENSKRWRTYMSFWEARSKAGHKRTIKGMKALDVSEQHILQQRMAKCE